MLRSASIFLAAILLPSLVLAWLAVRSARDQQVLVEHQQAVISQNTTDSMAQEVRIQIDGVQAEFVQNTQELLSRSATPQAATSNFDQVLRDNWPLAEVGFAVDLRGNIYSPNRTGGPAARTFREENERFLTNRENAEVYTSFNSQNLQIKQIHPYSKFVNNGADGSVTNGLNETGGDALGGTTAKAPMTGGMNGLDETAINGLNADKTRAPGGISGKNANGNLAVAQAKPTAGTISSPPGTPAAELSSPASSAAAALPAAPAAVPPVVDKNSPPDTEDQLELKHSTDLQKAAVAKALVTAAGRGAQKNLEDADTASAKKTPRDEPDASAAETDAMSALTPSRTLNPPSGTAVLDGSSTTPTAGLRDDAAKETPNPDRVARQTQARQDAVSVPSAATTTMADLPASMNGGQNQQSQRLNQVERQVKPQNNFNTDTGVLSNTIPEESDFRRLIGNDTSGALARFLDNKLQLMVWYRPPATDDLIFGAQLNQAQLLERLRSVLQAPELQEKGGSPVPTRAAGYCLALLDDSGQPVALSIPDFKADWKHPFVATEIGETLPHWEAALYLTDPQMMSKSAHTLQLTLGLIVLLLVVAIVAGGSLIAADVRRQVLLAQQKTDFVSNVSHELKTPLTSIRMFADLLAEGRVTEPERQSTYLKIISAESARLTRLINNVLDFARQERGAPPGERRPCDLVETTRDVVGTCLPHLEANGQNLSCEIEAETLPVIADRDALAQIVLNLISNAEKYGGGEIAVRIRRQETAAGPLGCVDVLDRGPGVPPKQVESIFLPFHRLHDSLANGIPGSGLGLTLARRMARVHGGEINYTARAGGGSCFTLTVPLTTQAK